MSLLHAPCVSNVLCQYRQACVERLEKIVKAEPVPDVICIQDCTRYTLLPQSLCLHVQWFEVLLDPWDLPAWLAQEGVAGVDYLDSVKGPVLANDDGFKLSASNTSPL